MEERIKEILLKRCILEFIEILPEDLKEGSYEVKIDGYKLKLYKKKDKKDNGIQCIR